MKQLKPQVYVLLATLLAFTNHASAQLIGAQFAPTGTASSALYNGVGVFGESFVPYEGQQGSIYYSEPAVATGVAQAATQLGTSGVSLAISYPNTSDYYPTSDGYTVGNGQASSVNLYNNFLYQSFGTNADSGLQFTFSGLTPGKLYNIAAYSTENGTTAGVYYNGYSPVTWTVGVDTTTSSTPGLLSPAIPFAPDSTVSGGDPSTFALGVDYATASNVVADLNGDITLHAFSSEFTIVNGLSIEAAATPEPSTWAMMIGGLALLVAITRFRTRSQA